MLKSLTEFMPDNAQIVSPSSVCLDPTRITGIVAEGENRDRLLRIFFGADESVVVNFAYREDHSDDHYKTMAALVEASNVPSEKSQLSAQTISRLNLLTPLVPQVKFRGTSYGLSACGYDVRIREGFVLHAGEFRLASTVERFTMPDNVCGVVHDKSTWARLGIAVQNTVIEPGWCGWLTMELTNHSSEDVSIYKGVGIAQVLFYFLDQPTNIPYRGKYQDQRLGIQPALLEHDTNQPVESLLKYPHQKTMATWLRS